MLPKLTDEANLIVDYFLICLWCCLTVLLIIEDSSLFDYGMCKFILDYFRLSAAAAVFSSAIEEAKVLPLKQLLMVLGSCCWIQLVT